MKKILILLVISTLLILSGCTENLVEAPDNLDVDTSMSEQNKEKAPTDTSLVYEEFEYKITATDYETLCYLPSEQVSKEFLSALALGRTDLLHLYMQYDSEDVYGKAKFEFRLAKANEKIEYMGYHGKVRMTVSESQTDIFPNGEYDYTLLVWESNGTPVAYFGPTERLGGFLGEKVPDLKKDSALYHSHKFVESLMHDFAADVSIELLKDQVNSFNAIYHTAIHTFTANGTNYVGRATPEEFAGYIRDRFGYNDREILDWFADRFVTDDRTFPGEDGIYSFECSHGYSSHIYDLTSVEKVGALYNLTYTFYADSVYMVPCITKTFVFEENGDNDIMTLVDIKNEFLNPLTAIRYQI